MDIGTVLSVAQTLLAALQCLELKEILSLFDYKSQLDDLQRTVSKINAVFRDAETKEELSYEAQHWLDELKDAVFEADDLFGEFVTLAEQKQRLMVLSQKKGLKMPSWMTLLPNLAKLHLWDCSIEYLPCLGNLRHLKSFRLERLENLEYIKEDSSSLANSSSTLLMSSAEEMVSFFPSLEELELKRLPKFKGWRRVNSNAKKIHQGRTGPSFITSATFTLVVKADAALITAECQDIQLLCGDPSFMSTAGDTATDLLIDKKHRL
ncbi:hypothetical protein SOVF_087980 isoform B [Spinacia oleracea]|nr:hypothetical protein SOVF_087980 isoform B [Spinacia oleracea]